jgi:hypothetical protein
LIGSGTAAGSYATAVGVVSLCNSKNSSYIKSSAAVSSILDSSKLFSLYLAESPWSMPLDDSRSLDLKDDFRDDCCLFYGEEKDVVFLEVWRPFTNARVWLT